MKNKNQIRMLWVVIIVLLLGAIVFGARNRFAKAPQGNVATKGNVHIGNSAGDPYITPKNVKVTSTDFNNNGPIPSRFTCDGAGTSPEISISGVPAGTKSLALVVHDPDAPLQGGFTHWVMFNMPATTKTIARGSAPSAAVQGLNGANKPGYIGPCPPSGMHHYLFKVYALDAKLALGANTNKSALESAMAGHVLDDGMLVGTYQKK